MRAVEAGLLLLLAVVVIDIELDAVDSGSSSSISNVHKDDDDEVDRGGEADEASEMQAVGFKFILAFTRYEHEDDDELLLLLLLLGEFKLGEVGGGDEAADEDEGDDNRAAVCWSCSMLATNRSLLAFTCKWLRTVFFGLNELAGGDLLPVDTTNLPFAGLEVEVDDILGLALLLRINQSFSTDKIRYE